MGDGVGVGFGSGPGAGPGVGVGVISGEGETDGTGVGLGIGVGVGVGVCAVICPSLFNSFFVPPPSSAETASAAKTKITNNTIDKQKRFNDVNFISTLPCSFLQALNTKI